ncbi:MAG: hypothetical protein WC759_05730 [Candidatus Micrarchaeia archaeon]
MSCVGLAGGLELLIIMIAEAATMTTSNIINGSAIPFTKIP